MGMFLRLRFWMSRMVRFLREGAAEERRRKGASQLGVRKVWYSRANMNSPGLAE